MKSVTNKEIARYFMLLMSKYIHTFIVCIKGRELEAEYLTLQSAVRYTNYRFSSID